MLPLATRTPRESHAQDTAHTSFQLLLLGQAESGKSTLQKQFQLLYNPSSLDEERLSWRSVVFFNIARPVRRILEALESFGDEDDDEEFISEAALNAPSGLAGASDIAIQKSPSASQTSLEKRLVHLRLRLSPLLTAEASLAERLSGGIDVSGSGKGSVFVRSGWQSRAFGLIGRSRERTSSGGRFSFSSRSSVDQQRGSEYELQARRAQTEEDKFIADFASILNACQADIRELWELPAVRRLRDRRRFKLEEWAD